MIKNILREFRVYFAICGLLIGAYTYSMFTGWRLFGTNQTEHTGANPSGGHTSSSGYSHK